MKPEEEAYLKELYYNTDYPCSFQGPSKLYNYIKDEGKYKIGLYKITQWLLKQSSYYATRQSRNRYAAHKFLTPSELWHTYVSDLIDFSKLKSSNDNYAFIMITMDVLSRFVWGVKLHRKTSSQMIDAFKYIFKTSSKKPKKILSDRGTEYTSRHVKKYLDSQGIKIYFSSNISKVAMAERVIKTIKSSLFRIMRHEKNLKIWIPHFQGVIDNYNRTRHSATKFAPADVNADNFVQVLKNQYYNIPSIKPRQISKNAFKNSTTSKYKFPVGSYVRLASIKQAFYKVGQQTYTDEIFRVKSRFMTQSIALYRLVDGKNDSIIGSWQEAELIRAYPVHQEWKIDSIIKTRIKNNITQKLIVWKNKPKSYNSWINETNLSLYE